MRFENPLLLTVKMFLADVRSWRIEYRFPKYVCTDFAKMVYDAATIRGMRCGYTLISFDNSRISHAIVAFETDYGLVYFEPQTGDQEEIRVGKPYPSGLEGVPYGCLVRDIDIIWNDEHPLKFVKCADCGYLLPVCCPVCGSDNINFAGESDGK